MNRGRSVIMALSLLLGTTLFLAIPGVTLPGAEAEDANPTLSEQLFRVEWIGGASPPDQFRIVGYVYNDYGQDAVNVQLRISEVDASGRPVGSVVKPVGDTVPASGRAFFDVRVPGTTPFYRVAVESFGFMEDRWTTEATDNGQLYYVYADPDLCKCMYVGTAAQYEQARQQRLANDQLVAVQDHMSVPILWELWPTY